MATGVDGAHVVQGETLRPMTFRWVLKRSLVGIVILVVAMGALAWLTYASIDPDLDGDATPKAASAQSETPPRTTAIDL